MKRDGSGSIYQRKDGYWVGAVEAGRADNGKRRRRLIVRRDRADVIKAMDQLRQSALDKVFESAVSLETHGHFVYCLWGEDDETPLYVGRSTNVLSRVGSHLADATKKDVVRRVSLIPCETQHAMNLLEARLIRTHQPLWNRFGLI